eukprot:scaffold11940_cov106-Isochrysis_galbana.AAC.5
MFSHNHSSVMHDLVESRVLFPLGPLHRTLRSPALRAAVPLRPWPRCSPCAATACCATSPARHAARRCPSSRDRHR